MKVGVLFGSTPLLPVTILQRVLNCPEVRTWPLRGEKRRFPRVPIRQRVMVQPVIGQTVSRSVYAWTKDVSPGGIGLIAPCDLILREQFLLRCDAITRPRLSDGDDAANIAVILCRTASLRLEPGIMLLVGAEFSQLLVPGVLPLLGTSLSEYCWIDVHKHTPVDPFLGLPTEAHE